MRLFKVAAGVASCFILGSVAAALSAVSNGSFTATWTPAVDPAEQYEFRWRHFASPDWIALPTMPGAAGSMLVAFKALPNTPATDRWMCVDARMVKPTVGVWLSETPDGPACDTVNVSVIPVPTPPPAPAPIPVPPAPVPVPPAPEIFGDLTNSNGLLSFSYKAVDCPRGVQQSTGALMNGLRTITLRCRK